MSSCPGCHDTPLPLYNEHHCVSSQPVILPVCSNGEKCEETLDAGCVIYSGDPISRFGIATDDRMDAILHKLDTNSTSNNIIVANTPTVFLTGLVNGETTFTKTVASTTNSTTLVLNNGTDITPGQLVTGTNIDSDTKVVSITVNTLVISKPVLGIVTNGTLTFTRSAGVGLVSNPLIANVKKSTSTTNGDNQLQLLSDGLYISPKIKTTSDDTTPAYLNNKLVAGTGVTITSSTDTTYGKILTIASTGGSNIAVADTATIDLTLTPGVGNAPSTLSADLKLTGTTLPTPVITINSSFYKNDGITAYTASFSGNSVTVDVGAKINISNSTYKYTKSGSQSIPTSVSGDGGWQTTPPPNDNTDSPILGSSSSALTSNTPTTITKSITLSAPSSGLIVVGNQIQVGGSGTPVTTTASINMKFSYRYFYGKSTNPGLTTLTDFRSALFNNDFTLNAPVTGSVVGGVTRSVLVTGVTTVAGEYYYFCIPTNQPLTSIIKDGATGILPSFLPIVTNASFVNDAGLTLSYNIYRTGANPFGLGEPASLQFNFTSQI